MATAVERTDDLSRRAEAYWRLRQAKNLPEMYEFYSKAYRARVPQEEFLKLTRLLRIDFSDVRVVEVVASGEVAEVTVALSIMKPGFPNKLEAEATEAWVREQGVWYKKDEPLVLPFPPAQRPPRDEPSRNPPQVGSSMEK